MDQVACGTKFGIRDKESIKHNLLLVVLDGFFLCLCCYNHNSVNLCKIKFGMLARNIFT
jgi:hypothetical protein